VVGDGVLTLRALIEAMPRDPHEPVRKLHGRDAAGWRVGLDDVPGKGQHVGLEGPANRAAGGGAEALSDGAPKAMAELAINAANALDLELAAVDMFDPGGGAFTVIEVNSNPMIATLEDQGRWDLIETIWRANFAAALK
jgi:glutathione synthase/RimK-type ligase-like ATP-grasp enzyme